MRTVFTLPGICLVTAGTVVLLGCSGSGSSSQKVSSYRPLPYYEVYKSGNYSHAGMGSYQAPAGSYSSTPYANLSSSPYASRSSVPLVTGQGVGSTSTRTVSQPVVTRTAPRKSPSSLYGEVRVRKDYISTRARGRRDARSMRARYITIHSTQNWSKGADAYRHALALKNSKLGKLSWHYTTDENVAVQHLPTTITGNHADFNGPGNRYSIGIEMCEHPGNSRAKTVERTAKLAAYLMNKYDIPLSRVVPHYHWPRHGMSPAHKNCPHFLLNNGRPGSKWRGFQAKVKKYHDDITKGGTVYASR